MTEERKPKILTRLRIDEVSAVDRGAGEGVKIVLMKRDEDDRDGCDERLKRRFPDYDPQSYKEPASYELAKAFAALAESVGSIVDCDDDQADALAEAFGKAQADLTKSFAADAAGDEADRQDEATPVDDVIADDADKRRDDGIVFDVGDTRMKFPSKRALAIWLACQARIHKSQEDTPTMTDYKQKLTDIAKREGAAVIAKIMVADNRAYGITESELVDLISNHDRRDGETAAKCFSRHYEAATEEGALIRKAIEITKEAASFTPVVVDGTAANPDDARAATEALGRVVEEQRRRNPWMSAEQAYDAAMREWPDLTARAVPRPAPTSIYPMPR